MSNKATPDIVRLGSYTKPLSVWYSNKKNFSKYLLQDIKCRKYIEEHYESAFIDKITINRNRDSVYVVVLCAKPSMIVGKKGEEIDVAIQVLSKIFELPVKIKIHAIRKFELNAKCIAKNISNDLKKRGISAMRLIKRAVQTAMKAGAKGVKISCSGRLGGIEIARTEWYQEGGMPLNRLKANIDYCSLTSRAAWGCSGVKVWVYNGDFIRKEDNQLLGEKNVNRA